MTIALCCGSRYWIDREIVAYYIGRLVPPHALVIHGQNGYTRHGNPLPADWLDDEACRGADCICGSIAARFGHAVERYFADFRAEGPAAGPRRNGRMRERLLAYPHEDRVVLAFHDDPYGSKGTGNMLALLKDDGIGIWTIDTKGRLR